MTLPNIPIGHAGRVTLPNTFMIEIKSRTNTIRLFADRLRFSDLFRLVLYCGYRGDHAKIPFYYHVIKGQSAETDLTQPMDAVMAQMDRNVRNKIRRAEKEGVTFGFVESLEEFVPFYNAFCASKGLADCTSVARMAKYGRKLVLTKAVHNGVVLAMHANLLDAESGVSLLIYSCSPRLADGVDRNLISWANRFLHYKDLEYLKEHGAKIYDWCGVCMDPASECYTIGQFKLAFGGTLIDSWSLETPLYHLASRLHPLVSRLRARLSHRRG